MTQERQALEYRTFRCALRWITVAPPEWPTTEVAEYAIKVLLAVSEMTDEQLLRAVEDQEQRLTEAGVPIDFSKDNLEALIAIDDAKHESVEELSDTVQ